MRAIDKQPSIQDTLVVILFFLFFFLLVINIGINKNKSYYLNNDGSFNYEKLVSTDIIA